LTPKNVLQNPNRFCGTFVKSDASPNELKFADFLVCSSQDYKMLT